MRIYIKISCNDSSPLKKTACCKEFPPEKNETVASRTHTYQSQIWLTTESN